MFLKSTAACYSGMPEEELSAKAKRSRVLADKTVYFSAFLIVCTVITLFFVDELAVPAVAVAIPLFIIAAILAWAALLSRADRLSRLSDDNSENKCAQALSLVEQSNAARDWRDKAVASGRTLRGFDLAEMEHLSQSEMSVAKARKRKSDCKVLHGLTA